MCYNSFLLRFSMHALTHVSNACTKVIPIFSVSGLLPSPRPAIKPRAVSYLPDPIFYSVFCTPREKRGKRRGGLFPFYDIGYLSERVHFCRERKRKRRTKGLSPRIDREQCFFENKLRKNKIFEDFK